MTVLEDVFAEQLGLREVDWRTGGQVLTGSAKMARREILHYQPMGICGARSAD